MGLGEASVVQEYKDSLKQKAEHLIIKGFPEKIVLLNELLETSNFQNRDLADVHQDLNIPVPQPISTLNEPNAKRPRVDSTDTSSNSTIDGTRVFALPNGTVPCNKPLSDLIHLVKPHIRELVEDSNLLKMWISFMIPKIEDGNNFGVSIQEDTLAEIQSVESEAAAFFDQISRYFISRAKIVSKVAKYPHIEDYRRAVRELDEKEYLSLWLVMCEIRNRYCSLHDIVIKNLEKIKKPRSSNAESLY
ncbi:PREDICTED: proteasome activator complex subunit 3 isoform X2 [Papilio xuthus]|uniref:Proteasome activator complex subunit 3 isoform X2 n=1 Tax=Papilio xuthus TaxID=66420 RepID=A0AAJ7E5Z7_PAPXU|nr:PREDICTED: proteasome activator complex subunit 3 isoform X2 [Papilio xuthus]XP_013164401.1 PREDICTED: proteasome activator complex subunit 3 isoform X2 [Papilio xuthus]XP_014358230.2 proteasome activator complex subunit 3 isoform X1 [Papilio machaon]